MRVLLIVAVGCSQPARPPAPPPAAPAKPSVAAPDPRCARLLPAHREVLPRGREVAISRDGRGIYHGTSIDHFEDGGFAMPLSLEVFGQPWMPDARDRAYHAVGDHCIRVLDASGDKVELEVALQAAHEYDSHRCEMGCCPPGASTAPDGSEECCFCSDAPR